MKYWTGMIGAMMLAACGQGAGDYVGYWQKQQADTMNIMEIKKEGGHYFVVEDLTSSGRKSEPQVLVEKGGALVVSTGMGEVPLQLSDDGKALFIGRHQYQKIDAASKDKIVSHQEKCNRLWEAYKAAYDDLPKFVTAGRDKAAKSLEAQYFPQFAELEKDMLCNKKPHGYKQ